MASKQSMTRGQKAAETRRKNLEKAKLEEKAKEYSEQNGTVTVAELKNRFEDLDSMVDTLSGSLKIEALKVSFPMGATTCYAELVGDQWHLTMQ